MVRSPKSPPSTEVVVPVVVAGEASSGAAEVVVITEVTPPTPTIEEINPIIKIVQTKTKIIIKINNLDKSLTRGAPDTALMSQTMPAAATGRTAGTRPTAPTLLSAAGCTSLLLANPGIERLASLTSQKI